MAYTSELSLKDAIEKLLNAYKLKPKLNEAQLVDRWESIVGKMVEKHTRNLYIKNNKLFIKLDSSVVRQEMTYARTSIIEKVNAELGGHFIDDIIFL